MEVTNCPLIKGKCLNKAKRKKEEEEKMHERKKKKPNWGSCNSGKK